MKVFYLRRVESGKLFRHFVAENMPAVEISTIIYIQSKSPVEKETWKMERKKLNLAASADWQWYYQLLKNSRPSSLYEFEFALREAKNYIVPSKNIDQSKTHNSSEEFPISIKELEHKIRMFKK